MANMNGDGCIMSVDECSLANISIFLRIILNPNDQLKKVLKW